MKNSPVEIIAIGQDENTGEMFFSMTVKTEDLTTWLQSSCTLSPTPLRNHISEALIVESGRLFDVGQNADVGDVVKVYSNAGGLHAEGPITSMTDDEIAIGGLKYPRDSYSVRYSDGKTRELFGELHEDVLLDLTA